MATRRAAVGAPPPREEVTVDGVRLAYADGGRGPTVICLHAIGHGAGDFTALRERLGDRYRFIALDWPGHGNSADDRVPASAARYAQLLGRFLAALGLERVVLLGNSIGGAAAIRFAASAPAQVRGLALANPGGLDRFDALTGPMTRMMAWFFEAGARGARWYPRAFALYYRLVLPGAPAAAQRGRIVAAARESAPVLAQAWRSFGGAEADVRGVAAQITCPVWFAWATRDRINQLSRCRAAIQRVPNARLDTFPAGHAAFLETPDAFASAFDRFLRELPAGDARCVRAVAG